MTIEGRYNCNFITLGTLSLNKQKYMIKITRLLVFLLLKENKSKVSASILVIDREFLRIMKEESECF